MLFVVPLKELLAKCAAVLDTAETIGKFRTILQRSELALRIRIVVGDVRPAVRLGDPKSAIRNATGLDVITRP